MRSSILHLSRSGVTRIAGFQLEGFHSLCPFSKDISNVRVLGFKPYGLEGGYSRRWICKPVSSKAGGRSKIRDVKKPGDFRSEILEETVSAAVAEDINRTKVTESHKIEYCDIQQKVADDKELVSPVTMIVFDLETTGFSRENERIIEIAFRDLSGGKNSTFQTLVNPQRYIVNHHVHGIRTHMVNRPDIPRYSIRLLATAFHVPFSCVSDPPIIESCLSSHGHFRLDFKFSTSLEFICRLFISS